MEVEVLKNATVFHRWLFRMSCSRSRTCCR